MKRASASAPRFRLAVHGGAGVIARGQMTADMERQYRAGISAALQVGYTVLSRGGSSLDAVVAAVATFEDDPLFYCGRGAAQPVAVTEADKHGTAGAVALDANGDLAAATSTGGRNNKLPGRVGDSPIIGAGTYANNATVAVSCTGEGEYFMRTLAAHSVSMLMELKAASVVRAAEEVIHKRLAAVGGKGGLIALDRSGNVAMPFSSTGMYRGDIGADGVETVMIFADGKENR